MLAPAASNRPSIDEIMASPWMQGDTPSKHQIKGEMSKRFDILKEAEESSR
jgi:hypothetical protein